MLQRVSFAESKSDTIAKQEGVFKQRPKSESTCVNLTVCCSIFALLVSGGCPQRMVAPRQICGEREKGTHALFALESHSATREGMSVVASAP